ncbi:hypothetical protein Tco_1134994 [Tanacetum coccineum]
MFNGGVDMISLYMMFNGGVEIVSLYMRCSTDKVSLYIRWSMDVQWVSRDDIVVHEIFNRGVEMRSQDVIVVHEMFNGGVEMLSLYMRCSMEDSRCRDGIILHEMLKGGVDMISLYMRCKTDESRWYRCTLDVKHMSRDAIVILYELQRLKIIVVHEMLNGGVEMVSLYMRCSTEELRWYRCT